MSNSKSMVPYHSAQFDALCNFPLMIMIMLMLECFQNHPGALPCLQPNAIYKDLQIGHQGECYYRCYYKYLVSFDHFLQPRHDAGFSHGPFSESLSSTYHIFFALISQREGRLPNYLLFMAL